MDETQKMRCVEEAWNEYSITGRTNTLERYATGFVFAQMSARKGIKNIKRRRKPN